MSELEIVTSYPGGTVTGLVQAKHPAKHYGWMIDQRGQYCTRSGAQQLLDVTRRRVQFMDALDVRPSNARLETLGYRCGDVCGAGFDHTNVWHRDRRYLLTTEPYRLEAAIKVVDWVKSNGGDARIFPDLGMWAPDLGTVLVLVAPRKSHRRGVGGYPLDEAESRLREATHTASREATT